MKVSYLSVAFYEAKKNNRKILLNGISYFIRAASENLIVLATNEIDYKVVEFDKIKSFYDDFIDMIYITA